MKTIEAKNLIKQFRVPIASKTGFFSKLKNYFIPKYNVINAVNNLSFSISAGEAVSFIGPNGAGKSTTIKMLTGIMRPTKGAVKVLGKDPRKDRKALAYEISVIFGHCSKLWCNLPVIESLNLLSSIYSISNNEYLKRKQMLVDLFSIQSLLQKPVRSLSLGERMRCELVASFIHKPKVIFLDEPTIGLDLIAKARIRDLLRSMCQELKCTLLLTSHDTDDIEKVCDRVILINKGECVIDDSVQNIKNNYIKKKNLSIIFNEKYGSVDMEGINVIDFNSHYLKCEIDMSKISVNEAVSAFMKNYNLLDINIEGPSLESVIETFYR